MAFDDYLFSQANKDLTRIPKLAIDSFVNLYSGKINIFNACAQNARRNFIHVS